MGKIKLDIISGGKHVKLDISEASETHKAMIIAGVFGIFDVSKEQLEIMSRHALYANVYDEFAKTQNPLESELWKKPEVAMPTEKKGENQDKHKKTSVDKEITNGKKSDSKEVTGIYEVEGGPSKSNFPPLINSARTLSTSLSEKLQAAGLVKDGEEPPTDEGAQEWFVTGIKEKNGEPHYRCRYWCKSPECQNSGNHYIKPGTPVVHCHNCKVKLKVRPATTEISVETGLPVPDDYANFYIADESVEGEVL